MSRFSMVVVALGWFPMMIGCGSTKVPADATTAEPPAQGAGTENARNKIPGDARTALDNGEHFELFSLDPNRPAESPQNGFHGWKILGSTAINPETRKKIVAALKKGAAENDGKVADCFNPRHGIRTFHDGKKIDFVICFECYQVAVYGTDQQPVADYPADHQPSRFLFLVTRSPQPVFDQALRDANVPLAQQAKE